MTYNNQDISNAVPYTTTSESGVTLMEMIAALAIIAVIIVGSLALYTAATSSQASTQLVSDVTAVRAAVKQLYLGQGTYGTSDLSSTLVAAKRLPTTIKSVTTGTGATATTSLVHQSGSAITITGGGATFTVKVAGVSPDVCIPLVTNTEGWSSMLVGDTSVTPPASPATAATACGTAAKDITFTSN